jgi:hypothetical protein
MAGISEWRKPWRNGNGERSNVQLASCGAGLKRHGGNDL